MASTITKDQVEGVVTDALVKFGTERELITPEVTFESLDIDSLDLFELGQIIEEEFSIELKGSDVKDIATVGDLVHVVAALA
ncbi:MAG: acyl carrier protein [Actinobacteria bacterium]|nr:MAG: acyl carrier protein [Actinomycetota bacterium]